MENREIKEFLLKIAHFTDLNDFQKIALDGLNILRIQYEKWPESDQEIYLDLCAILNKLNFTGEREQLDMLVEFMNHFHVFKDKNQSDQFRGNCFRAMKWL